MVAGQGIDGRCHANNNLLTLNASVKWLCNIEAFPVI